MGTNITNITLCKKCGWSLTWIRVLVFGDCRAKPVNFRAEHAICAVFGQDSHDGGVGYEWAAVMLMQCVVTQP